MRDLLWPIVILLIVAVALRSELFFYMLYLVVALQIAARLWVRRSTRRLTWRRVMPAASFIGERVPVKIELHNPSLLSLPWLALHESLPPVLHSPPMIREVISLGAGEHRTIEYTLVSQRRGYFRIGPLSLQTGDVLGLNEETLAGESPSDLTIYPHVLPLDQLGLPASLPFGTLAARQRLFSDPARPAGVRPYEAADGVRRIDWKSTARTSMPQVRRYQPAIALETLIALAFTREEFGGHFAYDTMERALTAAASIAAHLTELRQPIALCTSGADPAAGGKVQRIPIGAGRAHLMLALGMLGRLEAGGGTRLEELLHQATADLGWGSTVIVITGASSDALLADLIALRRRGLNVALILAEPLAEELALPRRHGIAAFGIWRDGYPREAVVDRA
jgi:uncharacterized protein (DUF58 family)